MAIAMHTAKIPQNWNTMERMPGMPPTPIETACTPNPVQTIAASADPIMPHTSGNLYLRFTPKSAGSVTPR